MQVNDATTHIRSITKNYNGPLGKKRIAFCNRNYGIAVARFENAWALALNGSFPDAARLSEIGTRAVMGCENIWNKGGPAQKSPLTLYITNVSKILDIIRLLVRKLAP
ncbi:unnamed protein product [Microthlaspi erraticum]|uniref:Pectinesterase inhibitor domain-containing protein n=1 Tax=Microthlaspi erraticum TaxID=1685480 RepID=A0A6D2IG40_9BRAS|nr:unnamed protein product [Microthlaspi erraticum]